MLHCSHTEHGDLAAADRKVLSAKAQALGISDEGRSSIAATTGQCLMMGLVACSQGPLDLEGLDGSHGTAALLQPPVQLRIVTPQQGPKGSWLEQPRLA